MSDEHHGLQFVAAASSGWCDPETGVCHVEAVDEQTADWETMRPAAPASSDTSEQLGTEPAAESTEDAGGDTT